MPVLIVDDDPPSAHLVSVLLTAEGCDVRIAGSAEDALVLLRVFPARVVVLDLILPKMSGILLARRLKSEPSTRDLLLLAVSSFDGANVERLTLEAGCAAYIRKPIDPETFARTVTTHLRGR